MSLRCLLDVRIEVGLLKLGFCCCLPFVTNLIYITWFLSVVQVVLLYFTYGSGLLFIVAWSFDLRCCLLNWLFCCLRLSGSRFVWIFYLAWRWYFVVWFWCLWVGFNCCFVVYLDWFVLWFLLWVVLVVIFTWVSLLFDLMVFDCLCFCLGLHLFVLLLVMFVLPNCCLGFVICLLTWYLRTWDSLY